MKQLLIFLFTITLFTACNNNKVGGLGGNTGSGWSKSDQNKFMDQCTEQLTGNPQAKQICSCVLGKAEKKYSSIKDANDATEAEGAKWARECIAGGGGDDGYDDNKGGGNRRDDEYDNNGGGRGWTKNDRNTFLSQCQDGLTGNGMNTAKAQRLCSCVLGKVEKKYSSLDDANTKGGENAGAKLMQECVAEGGNDNNDDN
jgi:hypothetical protein